MIRDEELACRGLSAFRDGDFSQAIESLSTLLHRQPSQWTCRLYLAMAYEYDGQDKKACDELNTISQWASDPTIKRKAVDALRAINKNKEAELSMTLGGSRKKH